MVGRIFLGQAFNLNGFARHMYSTIVALAALSGYGVAPLLAGRVPPAWIAAPLLAAGVVWLGLRVRGSRASASPRPRAGRRPRRRRPRGAARPVLVHARRQNEASDFLRFHRDRLVGPAHLRRGRRRLAAARPAARSSSSSTTPAAARPRPACALFLAKADTFSLVMYGVR